MSDLFAMVEAMRAPKREPWRSVDPYAMVRGKQSIALMRVGDDVRYVLYGAGPDMLGKWPTYQEAMAEADRLIGIGHGDA